MGRFKAISVKQPYAQFINAGTKTAELRSRKTKVAKDVLIVSSKTPTISFGSKQAKKMFEESFPTGQAICLVDIIEVRRTRPTDADYSGEREFTRMVNEPYNPQFLVGNEGYTYVLANPRSVKADIKVKGSAGWFYVDIDDDLIETREEAKKNRTSVVKLLGAQKTTGRFGG